MPENVTTNMMESYFNSDLSNSDETPFHLITTNHPYMATLGLSQFTTGTLYRWWNEKNAQGEYVNHKFFAENPKDEIEDKEFPAIVLLGKEEAREGFADKTGEGINQFAFQAWRKEGDAGAGKYLTKYIDGGHTDEWDFSQAGINEAGNNRNYSFTQVDIEEYDDYFLEPNTDGEMVKKSLFQMPDGKGKKEKVRFKGISPITNVIALNDYVNHNEYKSLTKAEWDEKQFARSEFILDIQASKPQGGGMGYVEWSGYVPFYISLGSGDAGDTFKCEKPDWVKFRLYLYPNSSPKSSRRGVAMAQPTFAAPPVDALGRKYQYKEDGRFSAFPEGSQAAEVVGELDMTFNEYTGKWEAGSKQMVAVVTQNIPSAQVMKAGVMRNLPPEEMLKNPSDPNQHVIFGSGAAMPLNMQNGNPMQWTPNYAQASDTDADGKFTVQCPTKTDDKATLRVFNASTKLLKTDQMVLLNQIDGLWFAIDFPSGIEGDAVAGGVEGQWEFQYTATNHIHFFNDYISNTIDSDWIEKALHMRYYKSILDPKNSGTYAKDLEKTYPSDSTQAGQKYIWGFDTMIKGGGYHQFSSFDYMDNKIGGTRAVNNALGVTNPVTGPNGETYEGDFDGLNTGAFFGCIFPDGYDSEDISQYRASRNFNVAPTIAASGENGKPLGPSASVHGDDYIYINGFSDTDLPFNDGLNRNGYLTGPTDSQGNQIAMFNDSDSSLSQLPADIALNASPLGTYGQPIQNIHIIDEMYYGASAFVGSRYVFTLGRNWAYKVYDEGTAGVPDHVSNSAFDFKPNVLNRIMFRPLKAEAYAEMWPGVYTSSQDERGYRRHFAQAVARRMNPKARGASDTAQQREFNADYSFTSKYNVTPFEVDGLNGQISNLYNSFWGLQFNVDLPTVEHPLYQITPFNGFSRLDDSDRFPHTIWGPFGYNKWVHGNSLTPFNAGSNPPWGGFEEQPAGGVGIIGAVATSFANTKFVFKTDNKIGCWSWGYLGVGGRVVKEPSWGKGDGYRDLHTTNLFVKIYHHWPREQTIYDSRYFAIHHFNAGITSPINESPRSIFADDYYKINTSNEEITQFNTTTGESKKYWYTIDEDVYDIDIRIPSAKVVNPVEFDPAPAATDIANRPVSLESGDRIYGTRVCRTFEILLGKAVYQSLDKNKWNISTVRRGKLLPFKYDLKTILIPKVKVSLPNYINGFDEQTKERVYSNGGYAIAITSNPDDNGFYGTTPIAFYNWRDDTMKNFDPFAADQDIVMVVKNPGFNYKVGDTFSCSTSLGTGLIITVKAVSQEDPNGIDDKVGRVTEFEVTETGYDFSYSGFTAVEPANDDLNVPAKKITSSSAGIQVFTSSPQPTQTGEGFQLHLIRGEVGSFEREDEKPPLATATNYHLLSIPSNKNDTSGGGTLNDPVGGEYFGLEQDSTEVQVDITNKSTSSKYDLFFFFHNDISHTHMTQDYNGSISRPNNDEQYIDLRIDSE
jgi:hypothetical protein